MMPGISSTVSNVATYPSKAICEESTAWKPPSVSITLKSRSGKPQSGPLPIIDLKPFSTAGMNSLGMFPPTTFDSKMKPLPGSPGSIRPPAR